MNWFSTYKPYLIILFLTGFGIIALSMWYWKSPDKPHKNLTPQEKTWQTVNIKTASDFASIKLPAQVKSNQFAIISPRRNGIIQDLLVDIGDEVYKGQAIGSMLPEGVEGQSSAAINEASVRLQKARAELDQAKGVAVDAVAVATKQWHETSLQAQTQTGLGTEIQKQLAEKKAEAVLIATQAWENTKLVLFGTGANQGNPEILGNFLNVTQQNKVKNLAKTIQFMAASDQWNNPDKILETLSTLETFLVEAEALYKNAQAERDLTLSQITNQLNTIQSQQLKITQIKQSLLVLEEKTQQFEGAQFEKIASQEHSREVIDLIQSQQNLSLTQAEKNVEVALANYNAALVKAGHQVITSPFNGIITARFTEVGQAITLNQPLFYLEGAQTTRAQTALAEIHFSLPESWLNQVSVGDKVAIETLSGETIAGVIFRLSKQINLDTHSIMATAIAFETTDKKVGLSESQYLAENTKTSEPIEKLTPPDISPVTPINFTHGQSLFVTLTNPGSFIFTVPTLVLKKRGSKNFLWKMTDGKPRKLTVEIIAEDGEFSQVFSRELKAEDLIIRNPSVSLFNPLE